MQRFLQGGGTMISVIVGARSGRYTEKVGEGLWSKKPFV